MMIDMTPDRFDERVREAAQDYHRPPATPREELWQRITAARAARRQRLHAWRTALVWGVGIAAVLALGIALGRWSMIGPPSNSATLPPADRASTFVYQLAAAQYLTRTEALLIGFRAESRAGATRLTGQFAGQARDLLCTTRLMLDSPAARDIRLKGLLEDLEVVLAQIAQSPSGTDRQDLQLINQGLEQRSVLLRLRTANPAGPGSARVQGVM
jgi:hypothetical protein